MMKYIIYKTCDGNIELTKGDIHIVLTDTYNCVELDDDTYWEIIDGREHLIANGLLVVKVIEEPIVEEVKKSKKK